MKRSVRGFTLLESLVCLGMLGVLLVALSSMMLSLNATRSRVDASIVAEDRLAQIQVFLHELISGAVLVTRGAGNDERSGFYGRIDHIEFQSIPPGFASDKLYFCKLFVNRGDLVLSFQRSGGTKSEKQESLVLIGGIRSIEFSFFDKYAGKDKVSAELSAWDVRNKLPQAVRIRVNARGVPEWPALYVKMKFFDSAGGAK